MRVTMRLITAYAVSAVLSQLLEYAAAGGAHLDLPPILEGYTGKLEVNNKTGGLKDVTLNRYVKTKNFYNSRGTWYDITKWAARTRNCDNVPSSVACMACAMNMPKFTKESNVVPIAVANELFGEPEKGATCSMCLRIYLPPYYPKCKSSIKSPFCKGVGKHSYLKSIPKPWAWNGKIRWDDKLRMPYFTALIIEWFDRDQKLPYQITMPTQGKGPTFDFGDWPVKYKGVPCPVGKRGIDVQFLDFSKPTPASSKICNNQFGKPCGGSAIAFPGKPLGFLKLMLTSIRIPISLVEYYAQGKWQPMGRSGDGFWQPTKGAVYNSNTSPKEKLQLKIYCADGSKPHNVAVIPAKMLCSYQDPYCLGVEQPGVQC